MNRHFSGAAEAPVQQITITVDGQEVSVPEGSTILTACDAAGKITPTLCYGDTLTPKNACRVCMVELEGSRVLVPSCSRKVQPGMVVKTDSERVRHSRRLVLELLGSSVDLSTTPRIPEWMDRYGADPDRYGPRAGKSHERDIHEPGEHHVGDGSTAATMAQPDKVDNDLYVREYDKCILCYKCVDACGTQWQNTFAIQIAGRGFDSQISTEYAVELPDSACVFCGNCVEVCPTGALSFKSEYDMRAEGTWDEAKQTETTTICTYCGVGCNLNLHVQDNKIVKVTAPHDHDIGHGNLCIKGRFGFAHVQSRKKHGDR
ncbi:NAD-dependent formate dehydrogenase iron-sulfur protein [Paracoccus aminovorans]|uniref:NAD-dependent formate dehydrogenase iron-sulfur protein n=1 Tax=Paracoccus aminovorans TaxID=34004 RepID=A0A1I3EVL5_9RHOB|nr:2Fe-2S iron-sulfur cluster-binding protein [Paracoccus aminovorans]CQR86890.1 NADH dehydrogenase (ubiquinone), subunit G [Paracoccus aminovorans]SFI03009.1 NAD-dependent formate dehydrogenase iron-sulfur protein [Paracoccus aminovorans]